MILQRLNAYYDRLLAEGKVPPLGFQDKAIPYVVELDRDGRFVALIHTGGETDRGRNFRVPAEVKRSVNIAANLLWDNAEYVFGVARAEVTEKQAAKVPRRHAAFLDRLRDLPATASADAGVSAVLSFLDRGDFSAVETADGWTEMTGAAANISFKLEDEDRLVCERPAVVSVVEAEMLPADAGDDAPWCLITGARVPAAALHPAIKGVRGAQTSGANLVSFNLDAFTSHGWSQGHNAPVGERAARAYTTALNWLLDRRNETHHLREGDTTFVFWSARKTRNDVRFPDLLGGIVKEETESDGQPVTDVFASFRKGIEPLLDDMTPFHVLGIAPNAARLSIRLWHEGTVAEMGRRLLDHFDDLEIDGLWTRGQKPGLWRLLGCAAIAGDAKKLQDQLRGKLAAGIVEAILTSRPYPATLLARTVARCRAEQSVWPLRAALIKAVLNRRFRNLGTTAKEITVSLNLDNTNPGYRLGRLFAVLEGIQRNANPNVNTTIRDRYFGAAMLTPRGVFGELMRLKNAHLKKLGRAKKGLAVMFDKQIDEILAALPAEDGIPSHLSLDDQGRFILGYHHQRSHRNKADDGGEALSEPLSTD